MSIEGIVALMTCFQLESIGSQQLNHMQYSPEAGLQLCANVFAPLEATALWQSAFALSVQLAICTVLC